MAVVLCVHLAGVWSMPLGSLAAHNALDHRLPTEMHPLLRARSPETLWGAQGEVDDMREAMEDLLYAFGVDMVFAGGCLCPSQPGSAAA